MSICYKNAGAINELKFYVAADFANDIRLVTWFQLVRASRKLKGVFLVAPEAENVASRKVVTHPTVKSSSAPITGWHSWFIKRIETNLPEHATVHEEVKSEQLPSSRRRYLKVDTASRVQFQRLFPSHKSRNITNFPNVQRPRECSKQISTRQRTRCP